MWEFIKRLFGFGEAQEARIKRLARVAGLLVAANNPGYALLASTAFSAVMAAIKEGKSNEAVGVMLQSTLKTLVANTSDKKTKAAIIIAMGELDIDPAVSTVPVAEIPIVSSLVSGFLEGFAV